MIYSGHATMRYLSRFQAPPEVTRRVLETVRLGYADIIFIYRHPLDSLLTNWVWWRIYLRHHTKIGGLSQVYDSTRDLAIDLEQNFPEFVAFADGNADFFAASPGPRFLSFAEYVEETVLFLQNATLALRFEDFAAAPLKAFSRIVQLMSADVDLSALKLAAPTSTPYGHKALLQSVPRFRQFADGLDAKIRDAIEAMDYPL